jgi:hypothetical protein
MTEITGKRSRQRARAEMALGGDLQIDVMNNL